LFLDIAEKVGNCTVWSVAVLLRSVITDGYFQHVRGLCAICLLIVMWQPSINNCPSLCAASVCVCPVSLVDYSADGSQTSPVASFHVKIGGQWGMGEPAPSIAVFGRDLGCLENFWIVAWKWHILVHFTNRFSFLVHCLCWQYIWV